MGKGLILNNMHLVDRAFLYKELTMSKIGRGMPRARSHEEFVEIVKETLYEIDEIRASYEFDGDYMNDTIQIVGSMEIPLKSLLASLTDGTYQQGSTGLEFMEKLRRLPQELLPIKPLLIRIDETHNKGLESE